MKFTGINKFCEWFTLNVPPMNGNFMVFSMETSIISIPPPLTIELSKRTGNLRYGLRLLVAGVDSMHLNEIHEN